MQDGAVVETLSFRRISVRLDEGVVVLELGIRLSRTHLEDDDHKGAHEEGRVG